MGQSLVKNYIHITFGTKHREPMIYPPYEQALHAYLGELCNDMDCPVLVVGGYTDHIHILCLLSKNISLVELVKKIKGRSSIWMKEQGNHLCNFYWQDGYGAFSVNPADIEKVKNYILNQHKHHEKKGFVEEYRGFLNKYNVDFNEDYLWD
ncbi:IS200/IS605 family transposase [Labilibacter sediminis]|nr:IS200/IS605 family transposase [Labilibacter sediminis]